MDEPPKAGALDFGQLVDEWKQSGKSVKDFCEAKGISEQRFYYHKQKVLGVKVPAKSKVIRLTASMKEVGHGGYEISRGGATLRIPAGFDPAKVKSLLELLGK
jgi:hypothetical protein